MAIIEVPFALKMSYCTATNIGSKAGVAIEIIFGKGQELKVTQSNRDL